MKTEINSLEALHTTLATRKRPEDVAQMVLELLGSRLSDGEQVILGRAARGSLKQSAWSYSSMTQEFLRPVPMVRQVDKAKALFEGTPALSFHDCADPEKVEALLRTAGPKIQKDFGNSDFKGDRLNRDARKSAGLDMPRRQYNKRFRLLSRMEARLSRLVRETTKYQLTLVSKSALASRLSLDAFTRDMNTACFVAYFTARANLRSEFTISGQQKPFDEIAEMLLLRCKRSQTANWWAVAHVWPESETLAHLSDAQKGELLGMWFAFLQTTAGFLREIFDAGGINRQTLVVRRGNDSSTWNQMAGAWNKARTHWLSLLAALQMDGLLDASCPGKVLPLIAADVAAWHRMAGSGPSPDLAVWNELPLPWDVLEGQSSCGRGEVLAACQKHNVDPVKGGWTGPRPTAKAAAFRPTPELVHGVTVSNPFLAATLRKAGAFSAKTVKGAVLADVSSLTRTVENGRVIVPEE